PSGFRVHCHRSGKIESSSLGIQEEVRAVEEEKVGTRPGVGVVEAVRQVVEPNRDLPNSAWSNAPGLRIDLVPNERGAALLSREIGDVARKIRDLVGPGCPFRQRKKNRICSPDRESHRRHHLTPLGIRARERHLITDVRQWRGSRYALCRGPPPRRDSCGQLTRKGLATLYGYLPVENVS